MGVSCHRPFLPGTSLEPVLFIIIIIIMIVVVVVVVGNSSSSSNIPLLLLTRTRSSCRGFQVSPILAIVSLSAVRVFLGNRNDIS